MEYTQIGSKVIIRVDPGEELVHQLNMLCNRLNITLGTITGIGATNKAVIGLYDVSNKKYHSKELNGDHEIAPLIGNITTMNNKIYLHLHVNLANEQHKSYAGHLNQAVISATFEGIIDTIDGKIERIKDPSTGLNILQL